MNRQDAGLPEQGETLLREFGTAVLTGGERRGIAAAVEAAAGTGEAAGILAGACQSFYLFRKLHAAGGGDTAAGTLLGDYYFSLFGRQLVELDSDWVNERFAELLEVDAVRSAPGEEAMGLEAYLGFVKLVCGGYARGGNDA